MSFAKHIRAMIVSKRQSDLVAALEAQRRFWSFVGIATLVPIVLVVVILIVALIVAAVEPGFGMP